jgi:hypothetical protein
MQRSRDRLTAGLRAAGYVVLESQGTYFLNVDLTASGIAVDDVTFCERTVIVRCRGDPGVGVLRGGSGDGTWCGCASPRRTTRWMRRWSDWRGAERRSA